MLTQKVRIKSGPHAGKMGTYRGIYPADDGGYPDFAVIMDGDEAMRKVTYVKREQFEFVKDPKPFVVAASFGLAFALLMGSWLARDKRRT